MSTMEVGKDAKVPGKLSQNKRKQIGTAGSQKREDMPASWFLDQKNKLYPVKVMGKYDRDLLLAAARRARLNGAESLAAAADRIRERLFGSSTSTKKAIPKDVAVINTYEMMTPKPGARPLSSIYNVPFIGETPMTGLLPAMPLCDPIECAQESIRGNTSYEFMELLPVGGAGEPHFMTQRSEWFCDDMMVFGVAQFLRPKQYASVADIPANVLAELDPDVLARLACCPEGYLVEIQVLEAYDPPISIGLIYTSSAGASSAATAKAEAISEEIVLKVRKAMDHAALKNWVPMVQSAGVKRLVTALILEPDEVDAQGDVIDADTILAAAHDYVANLNVNKTRPEGLPGTTVGLNHQEIPHKGFVPVESWIPEADQEINGKSVKAGSWLMTFKILDDDLWDDILAGKVKGVSIGGRCQIVFYDKALEEKYREKGLLE